MGAKPKYRDAEHKRWREYMRPRQRKYDREIAAIRKKHGCTYKEAQRIRRKARLEAELEKLKSEKYGDAK